MNWLTAPVARLLVRGCPSWAEMQASMPAMQAPLQAAEKDTHRPDVYREKTGQGTSSGQGAPHFAARSVPVRFSSAVSPAASSGVQSFATGAGQRHPQAALLCAQVPSLQKNQVKGLQFFEYLL